MVIAITRSGYIKRLPVTAYREQRRGGIGVMGMDLKEDDYIEHLFVASTHDYILFFTSVGKVYRLKVHELPLGSRQSKGRAIVNLLPFRQGEQVRAVVQTRDFKEAEYLVFATKNGVVKKTRLEAYNTSLKADGIIAIKMREGDELVGVRHSSGQDDLLMVSRAGQAIRFSEEDVRAMGRDASGVQGMRLRADDEVIAIAVAQDDSDLLDRDGERLRQADAGRRVPAQGPRRDGREDGAARRGEGQARRRPRRARGLPGDADLERRHGDPHPRRGVQAPRPLDSGRDRHAPPRGRAGFDARAGRRVGIAGREPDEDAVVDSAESRAPVQLRCEFRPKPLFKRLPKGVYLYLARGRVQLEARHRMAISRQVDLLEPINLADHLGKVELYLGQVCQIAGISKMQLDYWTNKAQIPTKGKKQRIYDIDALETVMLIKQAKDKGLNLGAAIEAARRFREENEVPAPGRGRRRDPELAQRVCGVLGRRAR